MNQLIPITTTTIGGTEVNAVDARSLHAFLGVKSRFNDWIANRISDFGFVENKDYSIFTKNLAKPNRGRPTTEYILSLDMAKELSMVERTEKGKQARLYFIECERRAKEAAVAAPKVPQTLSEALRLAADIEDQKLALEAKVREDAPKVEFCDAVIKAHGDMLIREAAKTLGVRPTFLFDWLRSHDWITARNEPYSERVKQNVLRPRVSNFEHPEKGPSITVTAHVTPKGLFRIYQSLLDEGLVSRNDQLEMTFAE